LGKQSGCNELTYGCVNLSNKRCRLILIGTNQNSGSTVWYHSRSSLLMCIHQLRFYGFRFVLIKLARIESGFRSQGFAVRRIGLSVAEVVSERKY
jgi:hypothetical protein